MPILLCGSRVRCIHYTYPVCVNHVVHPYSGFGASSPDCALHSAINVESHVRSDGVWHVRIRPSNTVITWLLAVYSAQSGLETLYQPHNTSGVNMHGEWVDISCVYCAGVRQAPERPSQEAPRYGHAGSTGEEVQDLQGGCHLLHSSRVPSIQSGCNVIGAHMREWVSQWTQSNTVAIKIDVSLVCV